MTTMTVAALIAKLQTQFNPDDLIVAPLWVSEDVCAAALGVDVSLSESQVDEVMAVLAKRHDAEYGITIERIQDVVIELYVD